jgi:uncharacterized protein (DUF983 family)
LMWAAAAAVVVVAVAVVIVLRTLFNHSSYLIMISLWALLTIVGREAQASTLIIMKEARAWSPFTIIIMRSNNNRLESVAPA